MTHTGPERLNTLRRLLQAFDFERLFVEALGWNRDRAAIPPVEINGVIYSFAPIAEHGFRVIECRASDGNIPDSGTRAQIERRLTPIAHEHILIFTDQRRAASLWRWLNREEGKAPKPREFDYRKGQSGDALIQRLPALEIALDETDEAGQAPISTVAAKVKRAFDVEKVTKRFYDRFKTEHTELLKAIGGIPDPAERAWYASILLNRLMFLYFVQQKGLLDGQSGYLRGKFNDRAKIGIAPDQFYRDFLCVLFFEGLASDENTRAPGVTRILGKIPYLNGGLFLRHAIEERNPDIQIADAAFERLFAFFDEFRWHLDERPLKLGNEINPDVLGFIFEKYINQKQMGAYYTKEDITDYICKYTILPCLLERAGVDVARTMREIEPYSYEAVKTTDRLPTETDREYAARRARFEQIKADFAAGKIGTVNDLITYNLDIRLFAEDWLRGLTDPAILHHFYFECLKPLSVLDPTCGSGAFLFAAMNILEPLYELSLDKLPLMVEYLAKMPSDPAFGAGTARPMLDDFAGELARLREHPNRRYFVFKSIIVNNLYGVDIMDEAVEICKLRLFLKLAAQVDDPARIEPLPDIDFNIRAGNTLVGFATRAEIEGDLFARSTLPRIETMTGTMALFRAEQLRSGVSVETYKKLKANVREKASEIAAVLDKALMDQYGQGGSDPLETFRRTHKPFHWYAEFNHIMARGGFDVIVGNPPYVEYSKVKKDYSIRGYDTEKCGNLYAFVLERSLKLSRGHTRLGLIVPISLTAAQRMKDLQNILFEQCEVIHLSSFALRPASLFPGVMQRLTIVIALRGRNGVGFTTDYITWYSEERESLFDKLHYLTLDGLRQEYSIPKVNDNDGRSALAKVLACPRIWRSYSQFRGEHIVYYHNAGGYWVKTFDFKPYYRSLTKQDKSHTTISELQMPTEDMATLYLSIMNSSLYYFFWKSLTDARHIYPSDIALFPIKLPISEALSTELRQLRVKLMNAYRNGSKRIIYGQAEVDQFDVAPCKPIIDEIDRVLAQHYGFSAEELDFIINYDIKYRMGRDADTDEGEDGEGE